MTDARKWKPIATAPKDRPIEICGYPYSNAFNTASRLLVEPTIWERGFFQKGRWKGWDWRIPPSHWRDLPEPPISPERPSPPPSKDD